MNLIIKNIHQLKNFNMFSTVNTIFTCHGQFLLKKLSLYSIPMWSPTIVLTVRYVA